MSTAVPEPSSSANQPDYARLFAVLQDIMSSLSELSFDDVLQKIAASASQVLAADRATVFVVDEVKREIWSKVAQGASMAEIRVPLGAGIVGAVASSGETVNIPDAYSDPRFNQEVDRRTGYRTRSILCMPMRNREGKVLGVFQLLNKRSGPFTTADELLLGAFAAQAAIAMQNVRLNEELRHRMEVSETLLRVMRVVSSELALDQLLSKIVTMTSEVMAADRATLFLLDKQRGDLWSKVAMGMGAQEIRVPMGAGIVGHVAVSGQVVNIPDCYADSRFNPEVDRRTGYRTRNMLCMPLRNDQGETVGVMQVLNKKDGAFTAEDESLMNALGSQTSIALENSHLFEEVQFMRRYNEAILHTIASGVVTLDREGAVEYANPAARLMFGEPKSSERARDFRELFHYDLNAELLAGVDKVLRREGDDEYTAYQYRFLKPDGDELNMNLHVLPLRDEESKSLGLVIVADDITQEQKLMSALCRSVTRQVAEKIMKDRDTLKLGGTRQRVTVLFSDIRNFTTISEQSTAEETVSMLNDYFSRMADPIFKYDGVLDKFIGDAIMAHFGALVPREDDAMCAVLAAREMRQALRRYNRQRVMQGKNPIEIGVGITKGEVISGNIGSQQRMDYTVIGDTVNVASRLEGLSKNYDCKIIINEQVYCEVKDQIPCVDLGMAAVKGKGESVHLFGVPDPEEQRIFERVALSLPVSFGIGDNLFAGQTVDISEGGIAVASDHAYPVGSDIEVHCRLNQEWLRFPMRVLRVLPRCMGLGFTNVSAEDLVRIHALMGVAAAPASPAANVHVATLPT